MKCIRPYLLLVLLCLWGKTGAYHISFEEESSSLTSTAYAQLTALYETYQEQLHAHDTALHLRGISHATADTSFIRLSEERLATIRTFFTDRNISPEVIQDSCCSISPILHTTRQGRILNSKVHLFLEPHVPETFFLIKAARGDTLWPDTTHSHSFKTEKTELVSSRGDTLRLLDTSSLTIHEKGVDFSARAGEMISSEARPLCRMVTIGPICLQGQAHFTQDHTSFRLIPQTPQDTLHIIHEDTPYEILPSQGFYSTDTSVSVVHLPESPKLLTPSTFYKIPGEKTILRWSESAPSYDVSLYHNDTLLYSIHTSETVLEKALPYGEVTLHLRGRTPHGFLSRDSTTTHLGIQRKTGLAKLHDFHGKDTLTSHNRFYTFRGTLRPNTSLHIDADSISLSDDKTFEYPLTLEEGAQTYPFVLTYDDGSEDTLFRTITYTGYDERYYLEDSLMGLPAFTPTGRYILEGTIPNAASLAIRGEAVDLDSTGRFSHPLRFGTYGTHTVNLDVVYTSGYEKTLSTKVERIHVTNELERNLFHLFTTAVISGMVFLVSFGIDEQ
ncbi:hypothetical protein [Chitinivibrio alkaliphilus]|uniref:OmpA-like domain-containing protein n=1 Tax=Chitinivibrio alkaliphilus ACht1 TaxID=1313304 RepID=U7DE28_9BACT|nr:hypothetical protein [Chitinivibrio alkaliphilus]ERP39171.1 hypothetical protein CALK_0341 [Chitinivibrio alkaliphilus ACht1]